MESRMESFENRVTTDEAKLMRVAEKTAENSKGIQDLIEWQKRQNGSLFRQSDMINSIMQMELPELKQKMIHMEVRLQDSINKIGKTNEKTIIALLVSLLTNLVLMYLKACK